MAGGDDTTGAVCFACGHANRRDCSGEARRFGVCAEHGPVCERCELDLGYWDPRDACPVCSATTRSGGYGFPDWRPADGDELREHLVVAPELPREWLRVADALRSAELCLAIGPEGTVVGATFVSGDERLGAALRDGPFKGWFRPFVDPVTSSPVSVTGRLTFAHGPGEPAPGAVRVLPRPWTYGPDDSHLCREAGDADTPPSRLAELATCDRERVRAAVALNRAAPPDLLASLVGDPAVDVRRCLAVNRSAPAAVRRTLAEDPAPMIRYQLARTGDVSRRALAAFAADPSDFVRWGLGQREGAPPSLLRTLAADTASRVRAAVAANARTPVAVLAELSADPDPTVRGAVAANARAPRSALAALRADSCEPVRIALARNPATPPSALVALAETARHSDSTVSKHVAAHPSTPKVTLAALARHDSEHVRIAVAYNPSTPSDIRDALADLVRAWEADTD